MKGTILIISFNARYIASSAKKAGYKVYCISHHFDQDLKRYIDGGICFDEEPSDIRPYLKNFDFDHVVLGSGFEDANVDRSSVLGNDPKISGKVLNKVWLSEKLDDLNIKQPRIFNKDNVEYPCIAKPIKGGGGHKNYLVEDRSMLPDENEYFLQEYITGLPLSVSVLSDNEKAKAITLNEILVGRKSLDQIKPFGYCGNVTPYDSKYKDEMFRISERLITELGLVGSNGVDFMINKNGIYVLEVNPRFQGSLESVEMATGCNIFKAHTDAINGKLDEIDIKVRRYGIKGIFFAKKKVMVTGNMCGEKIADIPTPGEIFEEGCAIATTYGSGKSRGEASRDLQKNLRGVKKNLVYLQ